MLNPQSFEPTTQKSILFAFVVRGRCSTDLWWTALQRANRVGVRLEPIRLSDERSVNRREARPVVSQILADSAQGLSLDP